MKPIGWPALAIAAALFSQGSAKAAELVIVGTGDGMDLLNAIGSSFSADNPGSLVLVPPSIGSGGGIGAVGTDAAVLARVARPLSTSEKQAGLVYTAIARIPSAIYVHPKVGVTSLTSDQVAGLFSGKYQNWKEVGGADLRVRVVRREDVDSTLLVLREMMPGWRDLQLTDRSKLATTTQEAIETVRSTPGAIGFGPYSKSLEQAALVLRIDGRHPQDREYPSGATLAFVHKDQTVTGEARAFMSYAASNKARTLITALGAIPVSP